MFERGLAVDLLIRSDLSSVTSTANPMPDDFFVFIRYPIDKLGKTLDDPFISSPSELSPAWLRHLEMQLAMQEEKVRSSPHFDEEKPPKDFTEFRWTLFRVLVALGNYYGFVTLRTPPTDGPPVDIDSAFHFLRRAVALFPLRGEQMETTVGYAQLCMGAVAGLVSISLFDQNVPCTNLMERAIEYLKVAEENGIKDPKLYHLKAFLQFDLQRYDEAAATWKMAADKSQPPSSKMKYNEACAWAKWHKYSESLTALELAIEIFRRPGGNIDGFDPQKMATSLEEGPEFEPFRAGIPAAQNARSDQRKELRGNSGLKMGTMEGSERIHPVSAEFPVLVLLLLYPCRYYRSFIPGRGASPPSGDQLRLTERLGYCRFLFVTETALFREKSGHEVQCSGCIQLCAHRGNRHWCSAAADFECPPPLLHLNLTGMWPSRASDGRSCALRSFVRSIFIVFSSFE